MAGVHLPPHVRVGPRRLPAPTVPLEGAATARLLPPPKLQQPQAGLKKSATSKSTLPQKKRFGPLQQTLSTEFQMQNQIINVYKTPATQLITTTEYKRRLRLENNKKVAAQSSQKIQEKIKATKIQEDKIKAVKKYMQFRSWQAAPPVQQQLELEMRMTQDVDEEKFKEVSQHSNEQTDSGRKLSREPTKKSIGGARFSKRDYSTVSKTDSKASMTSQEQEYFGESAEEFEGKGHKPSWTYFDQHGEDDDGIHVDVGTDSKDRPTTPALKPKMYNVSVGVKPKDMTKVRQTVPWKALNPKKYDVSVGVGAQDGTSLAMLKPSKKSVLLGVEDEAKEIVPEDDEYTHADILAMRHLEPIRLARKFSHRYEAATLARPQGYRELIPLSLPMSDGLTFENGTQASEFEIEQMMAAKRGIVLAEGNILWPLSRDFTVEKGKRNVEDYVKRTWKLEKEWMFNVRYLQSHNTNFRRKYIYQVEFSTPTIQVPVPPATASVFFVFEIGHYAHLDDPVKIHYCLEGTRFTHIPGHLPFNPKWLTGIIADKLRVFRSIDF